MTAGMLGHRFRSFARFEIPFHAMPENWMNEWMKSPSRVWLFVTLWTVAYQAPPSMGFSRQGCWSGLPFPSPGIFPTQGWNPGLPHCGQTIYSLSHQGSAYQGQKADRLCCPQTWSGTTSDIFFPRGGWMEPRFASLSSPLWRDFIKGSDMPIRRWARRQGSRSEIMWKAQRPEYSLRGFSGPVLPPMWPTGEGMALL